MQKFPQSNKALPIVTYKLTYKNVLCPSLTVLFIGLPHQNKHIFIFDDFYLKSEGKTTVIVVKVEFLEDR